MTSPQAEPPKFGIRLRHARQLHALSLEELGAKVGLTEGYLSKIENDRATPTIGTLHKIVEALGMNINALFAELEHTPDDVFVMRLANRPHLETGHRRSGNMVTLEQLVPSGPQYMLQINIHVVAPGGGSHEPISHRGQEFGLLLSGVLHLQVNGNTVALAEGDSFYFDSSLGHSYDNPGNEITRVLWVNTPPTF
jgi:transcriptional regulator with XRE-family HTH domain